MSVFKKIIFLLVIHSSFALLGLRGMGDGFGRQNLPDRSITEQLEETREGAETNSSFDDLDLGLPSVPSASPEAQDRIDSAPASNENVDSISSSLSERDPYTWNSAKCALPNPLNLKDNEEIIIPPDKDELSVGNGFEEGDHYQLGLRLGDGAFGTCYMAVTTFPDPADDNNEEKVFCIKECEYKYNELLALKLASKEHIEEIVQFYGAKLEGKTVRIFMEFMAGGTIADLIEEKKVEANGETPWPVIAETDSLGYLEDVLKALKFLHVNGIVHRDVKGANVLLTEGFLHAKLADFGSAESIKKEKGPSVDIWRTGCLTLEMLNGVRSPLFVRGYQRQISCNPKDQIPAQAIPAVKDLLRLLFGLDRMDLSCPLFSAEEILMKSEAFPVKEFLNHLRMKLQDSQEVSENKSHLA